MMVADKFPNGLIGLIGLRIIRTIRTVRTIGRIGRKGNLGNLGILGRSITNILKFSNILKFTKLLIIYHLNQRTNLLSEGCRVPHSAKMATMGST